VLIGILLLSFIATALQRITGLGFAMLLAPFAVVALGTHQGIMITMVLATIASLLMVPSMWRDIEWSKVGWIAIPAVISTPLASWVGTLLNTSLVYILVGLLVMVGLGAALLMPATSEPISGRSAQVLAGVGAGAGGVLAGVGGPAMTIYGVLSRWPVASFAASLQPIWILVSVATLASRYFIQGSTIPVLSWWAWLLTAVGISVGMFVGQRSLGKVNDRVVFGIVIALAMIGAVLSLVTGVMELL